MRFSQRTNWNTEESALARAHRERKKAGLAIADLTASNPTRCGFEYAADLLAEHPVKTVGSQTDLMLLPAGRELPTE